MKLSVLSASIISAALLGGCASTGEAGLSEAAAARLAQFEKTGETKSCINLRRIDQIKPLDDKHFLVRVGFDDYYLNKVSGRCSGAASTFNRLEYTTPQSSLCQNEIIRVVDNTQGFTVGSCSLGKYERLVEKSDEDADENAAY